MILVFVGKYNEIGIANRIQIEIGIIWKLKPGRQKCAGFREPGIDGN
jgi:hypothetical protein